eukprot:1136484-Pelagomonas_calceolata.AAC.1
MSIPYHAKLTSSPSSVLRSLSRHGIYRGLTVDTCVRQPHQLSLNQRHEHLYIRLEQQLEMAQRQQIYARIKMGKLLHYTPISWVLVGPAISQLSSPRSGTGYC